MKQFQHGPRRVESGGDTYDIPRTESCRYQWQVDKNELGIKSYESLILLK